MATYAFVVIGWRKGWSRVWLCVEVIGIFNSQLSSYGSVTERALWSAECKILCVEVAIFCEGIDSIGWAHETDIAA